MNPPKKNSKSIISQPRNRLSGGIFEVKKEQPKFGIRTLDMEKVAIAAAAAVVTLFFASPSLIEFLLSLPPFFNPLIYTDQ